MMTCQCRFCWLIDIFAEVNTALLQYAHMNYIHIILINVHGTRLLETVQYSRALGAACSIQMPWLQIKAWGEKAQWKPESDPHSAAGASSPAARWLLAPRRERGNILTSASASCQLFGLAPLHSVSHAWLSLSVSARLFPMLWWEMSAPLAVESARVQIVWLGKWCLCRGPPCHDTSGDTGSRCLSALISDKRRGGQKSCLKVLPLSQWQNKTKALCWAVLACTTTTSSTASFLPSFLPFFLDCKQIIWGQAAGRNVFTIVNFNVCGSPLKGRWHESQKRDILYVPRF